MLNSDLKIATQLLIRRRRFVLALTLSSMRLLVGCGADPASIGEHEDDVRNGTPEPGRPEVVRVALSSPSGTCSGVLLTSRLVLTAGHCFKDRTPSMIAVDSAFAASFYRSPHASGSGGDLGLIRLDRDYPVSQYGLMNLEELILDKDKIATIVGYGRESTNDTVRNKTSGIIQFQGFLVGAPESPPLAAYGPAPGGTQIGCKGDSGAPIFAQDASGNTVLGGIHVRGLPDGAGCDDRTVGLAPALALNATWLRSVFNQFSDPPPLLQLERARITNGNLEVVYQKNFATCAHLLLTPGSTRTHSNNLFCSSGSAVTVTFPLTSFTGISAGRRVRLCHGNNYSACSRTVTVSQDQTSLVFFDTFDHSLLGSQWIGFDATGTGPTAMAIEQFPGRIRPSTTFSSRIFYQQARSDPRTVVRGVVDYSRVASGGYAVLHGRVRDPNAIGSPTSVTYDLFGIRSGTGLIVNLEKRTPTSTLLATRTISVDMTRPVELTLTLNGTGLEGAVRQQGNLLGTVSATDGSIPPGGYYGVELWSTNNNGTSPPPVYMNEFELRR